MSSPLFFLGGSGRSLEPSLWCESSDFGGLVWVLSQKFFPDTSWYSKCTYLHDICESFTGKYILYTSTFQGVPHLSLRECELTAFSGRYVEDPGR